MRTINRGILAGMAAALLFSACATSQLPKGMQPAAPVVTAAPQRVVQEPEGFLGQPVLWGGQVIAARVAADYTEIEVLQFPLGDSDRPLEADRATSSGGRFLTRLPGFLDPELYAPGRQVTVNGTIETLETRRVGEQDYSYPVVSGGSAYLWPEVEKARYYIYDPWWDPYWYPWGYGTRIGVGVGVHR